MALSPFEEIKGSESVSSICPQNKLPWVFEFIEQLHNKILSIFISKSEENLTVKSKITFEFLIEDLLKNKIDTKSLPENGYAKDT